MHGLPICFLFCVLTFSLVSSYIHVYIFFVLGCNVYTFPVVSLFTILTSVETKLSDGTNFEFTIFLLTPIVSLLPTYYGRFRLICSLKLALRLPCRLSSFASLPVSVFQVITKGYKPWEDKMTGSVYDNIKFNKKHIKKEWNA